MSTPEQRATTERLAKKVGLTGSLQEAIDRVLDELETAEAEITRLTNQSLANAEVYERVKGLADELAAALRTEHPRPVVGDGITDDTAAVQAGHFTCSTCALLSRHAEMA